LLLNKSKSALLNSIQNIQYPTLLKTNGAISEWSKNYKEIDKLNKIFLDNITRKAGVYSLFTQRDKNQWKASYGAQLTQQ